MEEKTGEEIWASLCLRQQRCIHTISIGMDLHCRLTETNGFLKMFVHGSASVVKMCNEDDFVVASAASIIILSAKIA